MRPLLAIALVFAATVTASAQGRAFGVKAGASFAVLALDEDSGLDYDHRIAAGGGAFFVLPVARHVSVQLEGLFSPRGAKLFDDELGATSTLLLDYLDFPVLARVEGPRLGSVHLFAGPYFGIRVGATRQIASSGPGFTAGTREDMGDEVERFETGLVAGGGVNIGRRWLVDARYSWGFSTVNSDTSDGVRFRSRALSTMIGFRF
jgi:Outer membrane protein beta-barrel domain